MIDNNSMGRSDVTGDNKLAISVGRSKCFNQFVFLFDFCLCPVVSMNHSVCRPVLSDWTTFKNIFLLLSANTFRFE